ncbi:MAG: Smr/MutS family protein [bacterium]|nr:Smr/MutS family protein [bacterium]
MTDKDDKLISPDEDDDMPEYFVVTDELDLHGFFPEQAPEILEEFIRNAIELQIPTVRIIHGKGKSKMKWIVHQFLKDHSQVLNFRDSRPESGGWGSTVVELDLEKTN